MATGARVLLLASWSKFWRRKHSISSWSILRSISNDARMFDKVLVANRGEIACRIMRTVRALGIKSVGVYSEADKYSRHVTMADEAYCIGPAPSNESYLCMDKIIDVAKRTGAQAIHPGYGFLSENKNFAELCQRERIEFIGPPASAIEKMGIKGFSKAIMSESSVPVVPGYFGDNQDNDFLKEQADTIGYPVLIKADLGGGGKGMRIVHHGNDFYNMLESCRSEAMKSFSDDKVLLEKYIEKPRHVEVQVFGDKHGNMVHLFERDCSVQRRHQKIIEEAPAPHLQQSTRESVWSTAVKAAQAVGYVGAGTVEFILDENENFYFMEMNTRLQVEHPITEMITGTDLVEWQLKVAAGGTLPMCQNDITCKGHAFEARVYAEDPDQDEVTAFYDPMIAKLVVWSHDRPSALKKLSQSLYQYQIAGVTTNLKFLNQLSQHPMFIKGDVHTGFIEQHHSQLFPKSRPLTLSQKYLSVLSLLLLESKKATNSNNYTNDPWSLYNTTNADRINSTHSRLVTMETSGESFVTMVTYHGNGRYLMKPKDDEGKEVVVEGRLSESDGHTHLEGYIDDHRITANIATINRSLHIFTDDDNTMIVDVPQPDHYNLHKLDNVGGVRSPAYSTRVNKVLVAVGDTVKKGQLLMTLEGMKMETNILSPEDGTINTLYYNVGDIVPGGSKLIDFVEPSDNQ